VSELDEVNKLLTERGKNLEKTVAGSENKYQTLSDQLTAIIKGTASDTGEEFFRSLVKNLAEALNVRYALVGILKEGSSNEIRTLALWGGQTFMNNIIYNVLDGPCEMALKDKVCFFPNEAQNIFPNDSHLKEWKIQSYLGVRLLNSSGKATGVLVVMDDKPMNNTINAESIITIFSARAEAEIERLFAMTTLNNYARELERSNAELTNFALIASHDLSEPLRKVMVFGDRLRNRLANSDEKSLDDISRMQNATVRMQQLIDDLLSYAKVTTRAQPFKGANFNQVIKEALLNLEASISESKGIVNLEALPTIEADPTQIRQLFQNLIGNALKYCAEGVTPVINISSQPGSDNKINIFIKDNGIGFEQEYANRIFGLFQRLHGRTEFPGTGMGLAICKKIVERHGGTIKAKSAPGKGSTFIITLPVKQIRLN
jgi:signal transduction histidine kinase